MEAHDERGRGPCAYLMAYDNDWDVPNPTIAMLRAALEGTAAILVPATADEGWGESRLMYSDGPGDDIRWLWYQPDGRLQYTRFGHEELGGHLPAISVEAALELWVSFCEYRFETLDALPWREGTGWVATPEWEERARRAAAAAEYRAKHPDYVGFSGPERPGIPCRREGCSRGAVEHSVLCPQHHYESVFRKPG